MMDLGKKLNSAQMITLTQIFTQQPRNTVSPPAFNSSHSSTSSDSAEFRRRALLSTGTQERRA
jgi:hypothetical protein